MIGSVPLSWTPAQWAAITSRGTDLLVAAAAGAGKTAVLVERILHLLLSGGPGHPPLDVDRLLVVTFTDAAASEMRNRIAERLAQALEADPENRHLQQQLRLLDRAGISTLHSFCLVVIRRYFYRLDLDPAFRVAGEDEAALLQLEALEEVLEQCFATAQPGGTFLDLVESYGGGRGDYALQDLVLRLFNFSRSSLDPCLWLEESAGAFRLLPAAELDDLTWTAVAGEESRIELERTSQLMEKAWNLMQYSPPLLDYYGDCLAREMDGLQGALEVLAKGKVEGCIFNWTKLRAAVLGLEFGRLPSVRRGSGVEPEVKEKVQELRNTARRCVAALKEKYFRRCPEDVLQEIRELAPLLEELARLVQDFSAAYERAKRVRGLLDFNDLEQLCLRLLRAEPGPSPELQPSDVALELQKEYDEVLVDEYQDINEVQEAILQLVSRRQPAPNLFLVGDVKQSIYRFRLAEPGLFLEKYLNYRLQEGKGQRRIDLLANFRSRPEVIEAVNFIFRQLFVPEISGMGYGADDELVCGAKYPSLPLQDCGIEVGGPVELHLVGEGQEAGSIISSGWVGEQEDIPTGSVLAQLQDRQEGKDAGTAGYPTPREEQEDLLALEVEARLVAMRISQLVKAGRDRRGSQFHIMDRQTGEYRPATYRDIVILMRSTRGRANTVLEVLRQAGIPAYAELGSGYFEASEVELSLSLLKLIDNPRQDIPLAAVLRSPFTGLGPEGTVGLSTAELARVRLCCTRGDYYDAVLAASCEESPGGLGSRLRSFLERLTKWRTLARRGPVSDLIWQVYRESGYYDYVGGLPGGLQRQANLMALYERARQFEGFNQRGLFRFLRFIERLQESGADLGPARTLGENENVVRILSIHKSKGLEFPVVFVINAGKPFNRQDLDRGILYHRRLGLGPLFADCRMRVKYPTLAYWALRYKLEMEGLAEEMRTLYVALTRAKERLILVGSVRDLSGSSRRWCESVDCKGWNLPVGQLRVARSYLDWLAPALARHSAAEAILRLAGVSTIAAGRPLADKALPWRVCLWNRAGAVAAWEEELGHGNSAQGQADRWETERKVARTTRASGLAAGLGIGGEAGEEGVDPWLLQEVRRRLTWEYPFRAAAGLAAKVAVSELKRRWTEDVTGEAISLAVADWRQAPLIRRPRFQRNKAELSAGEKGTATHRVLQHLNLRAPSCLESVQNQISAMVERQILTAAEARAVDAVAIVKFLAHPLGQRLLFRSEFVRREVPFSLGLPAAELYPGLPPGRLSAEVILVQGIIDCILEETEGLLLLDFKTDRVGPGKLLTVADGYRFQLELYARAVKAIYRRPLREAYLYFLGPGESVRLL